MRKVLPNNPKTKKYLESLPKLYIVGCWAKYGVREYSYTTKNDSNGDPLVYDYYDGNGACDEYHLMNICKVTTGRVFCWTLHRECANFIAEALNRSYGYTEE